VNRFSSGALLMYQLSPELSSVLRKYFQLFLKPYTVRVLARKHGFGLRWLTPLSGKGLLLDPQIGPLAGVSGANR
jgi:hypothetical protein